MEASIVYNYDVKVSWEKVKNVKNNETKNGGIHDTFHWNSEQRAFGLGPYSVLLRSYLLINMEAFIVYNSEMKVS